MYADILNGLIFDAICHIAENFDGGNFDIFDTFQLDRVKI